MGITIIKHLYMYNISWWLPIFRNYKFSNSYFVNKINLDSKFYFLTKKKTFLWYVLLIQVIFKIQTDCIDIFSTKKKKKCLHLLLFIYLGLYISNFSFAFDFTCNLILLFFDIFIHTELRDTTDIVTLVPLITIGVPLNIWYNDPYYYWVMNYNLGSASADLREV